MTKDDLPRDFVELLASVAPRLLQFRYEYYRNKALATYHELWLGHGHPLADQSST